jgi:hypothetical protein
MSGLRPGYWAQPDTFFLGWKLFEWITALTTAKVPIESQQVQLLWVLAAAGRAFQVEEDRQSFPPSSIVMPLTIT